MTNPDVAEFEDKAEEALRNALEASKRAYVTCPPADRPASLKAYRAALYYFSGYVHKHMRGRDLLRLNVA